MIVAFTYAQVTDAKTFQQTSPTGKKLLLKEDNYF